MGNIPKCAPENGSMETIVSPLTLSHNSAGQPNWTYFTFARRVRNKDVLNHSP